MKNSILNDLSILESAIPNLAVPFATRQKRRDAVWKKLLEDDGFLSTVEPVDPSALEKRGTLGNSVEMAPFVRIGRLMVEPSCVEGLLQESQKYLTDTDEPALLALRSLPALFTHSSAGDGRLTDLLQSFLIRLFYNLDPTVVQCTVIDCQDFGRPYALISEAVPKINFLTESQAVGEFLRSLPNQIRERNQAKGFKHENLYEFNRAHRDAALPYHFVLVGSYEKDLTEDQQSILGKVFNKSNGTKAGIHVICLFDSEDTISALSEEHPTAGILIEVEREDSTDTKFEVFDPYGIDTRDGGAESILEVLPDSEDRSYLSAAAKLCFKHLSKKKQERVFLPLPNNDTWSSTVWKENAAKGIGGPIGKAKGELVNFQLGEPAVVFNALVGGAVGTGKSVLLNAIILQSLARYSPDELSVSILDYKNGTEFNIYNGVPHLYALSLGSGTKFGADLLGHFQAELDRRADLFKSVGAQNLATYREITNQVLQRHLVVIDEFQVLLSSSKHGELAKVRLEDLIRRGRSFGFTFILASQSLKDCSLTPGMKGNIGCRICLRLAESDCADFLSFDNNLPAKFEYVGQAVYNTSDGRPEGNTEFRVAFHSQDEIRAFLELMRQKAPGQVSKRVQLRAAPHIEDDLTILYDPVPPQSESIEVPSGDALFQLPFLYLGDALIAKQTLTIHRPSKHIFLGREDGIPQVNRYIDLDPSSGFILVSGRGAVRDLFESGLKDEIRVCRLRTKEISASDVEAFCSALCAGEEILNDLDLLVLRPKIQDSNSYSIQDGVRQLIAQTNCKLILVVDAHTAARNLGATQDNPSCEMSICCDLNAYQDSGGYGSDFNPLEKAAAVFTRGERDATSVKFPEVA
jgi:hypothetical protein